MQSEERIKKLIEVLEKRKRIKINQENSDELDTIHFLDTGDLVRIIYSLNWVLQDDNAEFLGLKDV